MMKAAFLAVGSELLGVERLDTNSLRATRLLQRFGVELVRKSVVGDRPEELVAELQATLGRFDLLVISGGLGPTEDDLTRDSVAEACGLTSQLDEAIVEDIRTKFAAFGRQMPEVNRRQAQVLEGASVLWNPLGTAPGLRLEARGTTLFLLPGVPREFDGLLSSEIEPWLSSRVVSGVQLGSTVVKVACRGESAVEEMIASSYEEYGRDAVTVLASPGEVRIELWARGTETERKTRLRQMSDRMGELLGSAAFTRDRDVTLEAVCGALLLERGQRVATAESCTGGLIAQRLTGVSGSSGYFDGSIVAYSNEVKARLLEVPETLIEEHGAVSREVGIAMARGARQALQADFGIGVTGIAGPGGGSEEKPVGTVHVSVAGPGGASDAPAPGLDVVWRQGRFAGSREMIRRMASQLALEMLRRRLIDPSWRPSDR